MIRVIYVSIACLLLISCGRPVQYGVHASKDSGVFINDKIRIYIDREGSLYPQASDKLPVNNKRLAYHNSFLRAYHQVDTKEKWGLEQENDYKKLHTIYGLQYIPASEYPKANYNSWKVIQTKMRQKFVSELNSHIKSTTPEALIILVHGYNNDTTKIDWYDTLQQYAKENYYENKRVQFLEIRWDGGTSKNALGIWGYAQHSMYPVGLTLRYILSNLENKKLPVRIFAHSTGAPFNLYSVMEFGVSIKWR